MVIGTMISQSLMNHLHCLIMMRRWKKSLMSTRLTRVSCMTNFKSYDELKTRLDVVLSGTVTARTAESIMDDQ